MRAIATLLAVASLGTAFGRVAHGAVSDRAAGAPRVEAVASKTKVSVGERFTVVAKAFGPPGTTFIFPPEAVQESFELRAMPADSDSVSSRRYQAAVFAIGDARVPPIPVRYRLADGTEGEVATASIPLEVVSLLPKEKDEQKLADIRGPLSVTVSRVFWIALVALALLLGALAYAIATRKKRATPEALAPAPVVDPIEEARLALDALVESGRLSRGEYRPFYIELTAIAKRYLERRLEAPIVEMTTAETLAHLRAQPHGVDLAPTVRDLSAAADQIKFAKGRGLVEEAERHLAATKGLIDTLETRLRPALKDSGQAA